MDLRWHDNDSEQRFSAYVEALSGCLGHADRVAPFRSYCTGLLLPGDRKSVEPMAARLCPERTSAEHQSLLHFVGQSAWDEQALLASVRDLVLPVMTESRAVEAWIVDDTGFPKKGRHSVGVGHQYCGQRGKRENCQIAVSLSLATSEASLPVAWRLYLPQAWAEDPARRRKAKVPASVRFESKPEIALAQITAARDEGLEPGVVLADAGYGHSGRFRDGVAALGLDYIVGVLSKATVWPEGEVPEVRRKRGRGRSPKGSEGNGKLRCRRSRHSPQSCPPGPGALSTGARAAPPGWARALPPSGSTRPPPSDRAIRRARRTGCSSSGPRLRTSRPSTGSPTCPPGPRSSAWFISPSCAG